MAVNAPRLAPIDLAVVVGGTVAQLLLALAFTQGDIDRLYGIPGAVSILLVVALAIRRGAVVGALLGGAAAAVHAAVAASELDTPLVLRGVPLVLTWICVGSVVGLAADRYRARLAETQSRQLRAHEEVVDLQRRLIGGLVPHTLQLRDPALRVLMRYQPGGRHMDLGGDFLDVIERADGTIALLIGDVSGHGPVEAALGAQLRAAWRALVVNDSTPAETLACLERLIVLDQPDDIFATAVVATVSADRRTLTIASAGHPLPLMLGADDPPRRVSPATIGPALAVSAPRERWDEVHVGLPDEFALMLYTDGLFEGRDGDGDGRLGEGNLIELLADERAATFDEARLDALIETVTRRNGRPLEDDVAVLVLAKEA